MVLQENVAKKKSSFYLQEGINSKSVKPLIEFITNLPEKSPMDLYINSVGGVIPIAVGVFNYIKSIKYLKLKTYNIGHCDSAAMLLYMLGRKRFATNNSSFYLHSLHVMVKPKQTISTLKAELENIKNDTQVVLDLLSDNSKKFSILSFR